jgi:hypothetical protein
MLDVVRQCLSNKLVGKFIRMAVIEEKMLPAVRPQQWQ